MKIVDLITLHTKINQSKSSTNSVSSTRKLSEFTNTDFPWLKNHSLSMALNELSQVTFKKDDIDYVRKIGARPPFLSGYDALRFIRDKNIRIDFDKFKEADIHAQYDFQKNLIKINDRYKNTINFEEILAISEAILHEAGHAKDVDDTSSMQEELDCLSMNVMAHRMFQKKYPSIFDSSKSPIIAEGVRIYCDLFFSPDEEKIGLKKRIKEKYGDLQLGDIKHPPSSFISSIVYL